MRGERLEFFEGADEVNHCTPDAELVRVVNPEHGVVGVGRAQLNVAVLAVCQVEVLHREATIPPGNDDGTIVGFHGAVDDYPVAIEDAGILHRIAIHIAIERSLGVLDEVAVEVQRLVDIVFRRRRESCRHIGMYQLQPGAESSFYNLDITHSYYVLADMTGTSPMSCNSLTLVHLSSWVRPLWRVVRITATEHFTLLYFDCFCRRFYISFLHRITSFLPL